MSGEASVDVSRQLSAIQRDIRTTMAGVATVNGLVVNVQAKVKETQERLNSLRAYVEDMRREQRNAAALQRAISEIIRIRQEIEQKFGKYQVVRDTIQGILQATDEGLVKKETISRLSEELMVSTPGYWLAPCVIAVAAWIANDKVIADKAVAEGLRRDPHKTSLLMALICRRNSRFETSRKWLTLYFESQDVKNISRSVLLFLNAYANGVFAANGEKCEAESDEFIRGKWLPELERMNPNFKIDQEAYWTNRFCGEADKVSSSVRGSYGVLSKYAVAQDFKDATDYLIRINASEKISADLSAIVDFKVDTRVIKKQLDEYLKNLVTDYDDVELKLRDEEAEQTAIKEANGDVEIAKKKIAFQKAKRWLLEQKVSLIEHLNDTISGTRIEEDHAEGKVADKKDVALQKKLDKAAELKSEQKLALKFTKYYIQESYDGFMEEKKPSYPEQMRVKIEGIEHPIKNESDKKPFAQKVNQSLNEKCQAELSATKPVGGIFGAVLALIGIIILIAGGVAVGVMLAIAGAVVCLIGFMSWKKKKEGIIEAYNNRIKNAVKLIEKAVEEWMSMNRRVTAYEGLEKFDIVTKI